MNNKELIAEARGFVLNSDDCEYGELLMWMADALEKAGKDQMQFINNLRAELHLAAYKSGDWSHNEHSIVVELCDIDSIFDELLEPEPYDDEPTGKDDKQ